MDEKMERAFSYWRDHPVECIKDWFGVTPEDYQARVLNDVFVGETDRTAMKSGHGVGKTTLLAWAGWLFLVLYDQSRVIATAPTFAQLHDVLWPEYAKWQVHMPEALGAQWEISGNHIRHKGFPKTWFAVSRTSNKAANLQGFHSTNMMIQVDEASGVTQDVFEVVEGIMSNAKDKGETAKLLLAGNPNFNAGEFYHAFNKNKDLYARYTVSGDPKIFGLLDIEIGSEHREHGHVYYSKRVSKSYCSLMGKKYGDQSGVYDVRVRGLFPREEEAAVIPLKWAQKAAEKATPSFDKIADAVTIVIDVAREGGDETVISSFRRGHQLRMQTWAKTTTEQCVDYLKEEALFWKEQGVAVQSVIVDQPGVGGGVVDTARRRTSLPIVPYHGGESLKKGKDPEDDIRMFQNRRARDYWSVRRKFEQGEVGILNDETTINQLASVHRFYNDRDKIQVESKRAMRDRLGDDASPDRADVIVMGLAPWYSFNSVNVHVSASDVIFGEDRPVAEMEFF